MSYDIRGVIDLIIRKYQLDIIFYTIIIPSCVKRHNSNSQLEHLFDGAFNTIEAILNKSLHVIRDKSHVGNRLPDIELTEVAKAMEDIGLIKELVNVLIKKISQFQIKSGKVDKQWILKLQEIIDEEEFEKLMHQGIDLWMMV
jgi:hypothetical protein